MNIHKDIVIFGGGIAGLWTLNRLRQLGYDAILLERGKLGQGQTVASQGMIHGGIKYALGGSLTKASNAIADMPDYWRMCLNGEGDIDLSGTDLLSEQYYMWPRNSIRSRLNAFLGSKALRGKVSDVDPEAYPDFFRGNISGPLYQLKDIVLNVPALLQTLQQNHAKHIYKISWDKTGLHFNPDAHLDSVSLETGNTLTATRFIFTGGKGNQDIIEQLPTMISQQVLPSMQTRPLQMVFVKHSKLQPVYVHCVSDQLTATPEVTITSHRCIDGSWAWYLGGEIAEAGAHLDQATLITKAKAKLAELFPWLNLTDATWHSFYIDRAEASQPDGKRPDQSSVLALANNLFCWPTKLTLAPHLANTIVASLDSAAIKPDTEAKNAEQVLLNLPHPGIASCPWDDPDRL